MPKKAAFARLEDVRGLLTVATHAEANKLFDVRSNLPHSFEPGSIDRMSYSGARLA